MFFTHIPQWLDQFSIGYILPTVLFCASLILWYVYTRQRCCPQPSIPIVRTDQDAFIYNLPPEMIQHIATFLQPHSAALFVLSNKYFLTVLGTQYLKVEKPYRLQYFKAIQQQVPNHLLCHVCSFFHPRRRHRSGCGWLSEPKCFHETGVFRYGIRGDFTLLFPDIQQLMNRQRFGKSHGFSVEEISYSWSGKLRPYSIDTTETASARFLGDSLLLRTESRCMFSWLDNQPRILAIYASIKFCPHISDKDLNLLSFSKRRKTFAKCSACLTEIRIRITDHYTSPLHKEVQTTSWYMLGSCREPFDSEPRNWKALTEKSFRRSLTFIWEREATCRNAYNLTFNKK